MIERQYNAKFLNTLANDPSIAPWIRGTLTGQMDFTTVVEDSKNYALLGEHGGVIFAQLQGGLYEAHTLVLPAGRGKWALDTVNECLKWMFTRTDAVEIMTRVPKGNLGARALVKSIHGALEFRNSKGWVFDHQYVYADIYSLTIQRWMKTAPGLDQQGKWFHDRLEQEYRRVGKMEETHGDDETHDKYVGLAVEMITHGQPEKAMVFYNRWAAMAGYAPIRMVNRNPLVLDIRDAIIQVENNDIRVLQ